MISKLVEFHYASKETGYSEMKDPSILKLPDGTFIMYVGWGTIPGEEWVTGRFKSDHPGGPWHELEPAKIHGVTGPQVCAPAVVYDEIDGKPVWRMYVQTACFNEGGVIALAVSNDGVNFHGEPEPAMSKHHFPAGHSPSVIGVYDVSLSDINLNGAAYECMVFSGYRTVGCGDVYMSLRPKNAVNEEWSEPRMVLRQEDVPFHNPPGSKNFEWGLEGAKIIQLAEDAFALVGVCFLDKGLEHRGTRQRVFLAGALSIEGPFVPINTPVEPAMYDVGQGENGHPDVIDLGSRIGLLYQERAGDKYHWHLRYTEFDKTELILMIQSNIAEATAELMPKKPDLRRPHSPPGPS